MTDEALFIPLDVLEEATSNIPLTPPSGADTEKWNEVLLVQGSQVTATKDGKKTIVEVSFKVADNGSPQNATKQFKHSFFLTKDSLRDRAQLAGDVGTKQNLRIVSELARAIGLPVDGKLIAAFNGMNPDLVAGGPILARISIKRDDESDPGSTKRFNINGFSRPK